MTKKEDNQNFNPYSKKGIVAIVAILTVMFGGNAGISIFQNDSQCNMMEEQNKNFIAENKIQISKIKDDVADIKHEQIKIGVKQEAIHDTIKRVEEKIDNP